MNMGFITIQYIQYYGRCLYVSTYKQEKICLILILVQTVRLWQQYLLGNEHEISQKMLASQIHKRSKTVICDRNYVRNYIVGVTRHIIDLFILLGSRFILGNYSYDTINGYSYGKIRLLRHLDRSRLLKEPAIRVA